MEEGVTIPVGPGREAAELELNPLASGVVQEACGEEHVCVWGWGRGSWGEGGNIRSSGFCCRCLLCLPFAALKAKKMSPLCGIRRAHKRF